MYFQIKNDITIHKLGHVHAVLAYGYAGMRVGACCSEHMGMLVCSLEHAVRSIGVCCFEHRGMLFGA